MSYDFIIYYVLSVKFEGSANFDTILDLYCYSLFIIILYTKYQHTQIIICHNMIIHYIAHTCRVSCNYAYYST